jgi:Tfp pilus assembly protein FimT
MLTVGVAALFMSLAVPPLRKMLANHRLKVEVDAIFHAIHFGNLFRFTLNYVNQVCQFGHKHKTFDQHPIPSGVGRQVT